jgi:hypothetical protein
VRAERIVEFLLLSRTSRDPSGSPSTRWKHPCGPSRAAPAGSTSHVDRLAGRLRASLDYSQIDEMADSLHGYVLGIRKQCDQVHSAFTQTTSGYTHQSPSHDEPRHPVHHPSFSRFSYTVPISESMMEVRMQPRSDGRQLSALRACAAAAAKVFAYQDSSGNVVHHFDIPGRHSRRRLRPCGGRSRARMRCPSAFPPMRGMSWMPWRPQGNGRRAFNSAGLRARRSCSSLWPTRSTGGVTPIR